MKKHEDKKILRLTSPIGVSVNHYLKPRAFIAKGRAHVTMYETADAKKYKREFVEYVKKEAEKQGWIKSDNRFQKYYMDCVFYFPRIDMDANNYFKLLADSITESECVWIDDVQLCERVQAIFYDSKNPRIEILIRETDFIGIFKNISQLETFKSNCIGCNRYKRNCSLLKNAVEGRIQDEITNKNDTVVCGKFKPITKN